MKKLEPAPLFRIPSQDILYKTAKDADTNLLINKIQDEYYYWDKVKYQPVPTWLKPEQLWNIVKLRRLQTPYSISFGKYQFTWNLTSKLHQSLHFLDLNVGGSLESSSLISDTDKSRYLLSSIMEEAIASSQIEGAVTTRKVAKEMLRKNIKPRNKSEQMIYNNYNTIKRILEIKAEPLTGERLLHIHQLVSADTMIDASEEGAFRLDDDVKIVDSTNGNIVHDPPLAKDLPLLMAELYKFFNEEDKSIFIHPVLKACIIHFMIGFIHPFADGNGRTARALFYWYMLKKQYWLTEYLSISRLILKSKAQYARAYQYTETDGNDLTYFLVYKLRTMQLAFDELREYIKRKNEEKKKLSHFTSIDGISYRQAQILEWFYQEPGLMLTVKEVENRLGVSNASARGDLNELIKLSYLQLRHLNKVTKGYIKAPSFDELVKK